MLEAVRGWLTHAVLFVVVNLVIATIAMASRRMPLPAPGDKRRGLLLHAPSLAVDRLRASISFSRLGLAADQTLFGENVGAPKMEPSSLGAAGDDGRRGCKGRRPRGQA